MKEEKCCGGIIFNTDTQKYLLIQMKNGDHWDFPKGHVESNETEHQTALREIHEEVDLKVQLVEGFRESISYIDNINNVKKTVIFFFAKTTSTNVQIQKEEVLDYHWLDFANAMKQLTYENAKNLLEKANQFLE